MLNAAKPWFGPIYDPSGKGVSHYAQLSVMWRSAPAYAELGRKCRALSSSKSPATPHNSGQVQLARKRLSQPEGSIAESPRTSASPAAEARHEGAVRGFNRPACGSSLSRTLAYYAELRWAITPVFPLAFYRTAQTIGWTCGDLSCRYTLEFKPSTIGSDTSEWVKTYTDLAGRPYKTKAGSESAYFTCPIGKSFNIKELAFTAVEDRWKACAITCISIRWGPACCGRTSHWRLTAAAVAPLLGLDRHNSVLLALTPTGVHGGATDPQPSSPHRARLPRPATPK
jgi:hypothetical protein